MKPTKLIPIIVGVFSPYGYGTIRRCADADDHPLPHRPPNISAMLSRTLQLTDAQKSQIEPLVRP